MKNQLNQVVSSVHFNDSSENDLNQYYASICKMLEREINKEKQNVDSIVKYQGIANRILLTLEKQA